MTILTKQNTAGKASATVSKKPSYTDEFKAKVLEVYQSGSYANASDCAKAYKINVNTFYQWINRSGNKSPNSETSAELAKLRKELNQLKMENQILKKATIYFANQAQ